MGKVKFEGDAPYELPAAQRVRADAQGETVALVFHVLINGDRLEPVRIALLNDQAIDLVDSMNLAIAENKSGGI